MPNIIQKKQVFSISSKYQEVLDILNDVDNKSEFICQAIVEKARGMNSLDDAALEKKIRKVLKNMIDEDDMYVVFGNQKNVSSISAIKEKHPIAKNEVTVTTKNNDDDDDDYLKDVLNNM